MQHTKAVEITDVADQSGNYRSRGRPKRWKLQIDHMADPIGGNYRSRERPNRWKLQITWQTESLEITDHSTDQIIQHIRVRPFKTSDTRLFNKPNSFQITSFFIPYNVAYQNIFKIPDYVAGQSIIQYIWS
jgi:hypothetical protein